MDRNVKIFRVTLAGSLVNMILLALKFLAGIFGHSSAMIADAVHSLSDFLTDIIVICFVKLSSRPADKDHDYGHGKYETMASLLIGLALLVVAFMLGGDSILKIVSFAKGAKLESPGKIAFFAALLSIFSKEWIFRVTRNVSKEVKSQVLEANAWHHRSDALSSIGTAIGIGGAVLLGDNWVVLDPIAALIVCFLIIYTALTILRKASGELLEESLSWETEDRIVQIVSEDKDVCDIHNLHTRKIGNIIAIEMHVRMPGEISLNEAHAHATNIERRLRKEFGEGTHTMLHLEPKSEISTNATLSK